MLSVDSTITYLSMFREMAELKLQGTVNQPDGTVPLSGVLVDHQSDSSDGEDVDESHGGCVRLPAIMIVCHFLS
jgi:hypothetical protein